MLKLAQALPLLCFLALLQIVDVFTTNLIPGLEINPVTLFLFDQLGTLWWLPQAELCLVIAASVVATQGEPRRTLSVVTATYPVVVAVTGTPDGLYDGVSATVSIIYERRTDVLTVSSGAISVNETGESVVQKVNEDGSTTETVVETGDTQDNVTEITSGLAEGDSVQVTVFTPTGNGNTGTDSGTQNGTGTMPGGGTLPEGFTPPDGATMPGGGAGGQMGGN